VASKESDFEMFIVWFMFVRAIFMKKKRIRVQARERERERGNEPTVLFGADMIPVAFKTIKQ
jgi:hypothetical protein